MGVSSFRQLYQAWQKCRRRKRGTPQAQCYEMQLLDNLADTAQAMESGSWSPARPVCFAVARPKAREIHAAAFADRVVHHWLVPRLEVLYEPMFIHDCYSNRPGKGTHAAVDRLQTFMHRLQSEAGAGATGHPGCFLQLDIANFFVSLDRSILFRLLQRRLRQGVERGKLSVAEARQLRDISHLILKQDVGREAKAVTTVHVPAHKRLKNAPPNKGLPIGNLASQFMYRMYGMPWAQGCAGMAFANVYLNELDQFIKHRLKCRYYLRYVDDMVLLHRDADQLRRWHQEVATFLRQQLALQLRPDSKLAPVMQGVDFLGYVTRPHYRLVRRRVVGNLKEKLLMFQQAIMPQLNVKHGLVLKPGQDFLSRLRSCLASYLGHFHHADSRQLIASIWRHWPWLGLFFRYRNRCLLPLWEPRGVSGYRSQTRYFRRQFPYARVAIQRGTEIDRIQPWADEHRADIPPPTDIPLPTGKQDLCMLQSLQQCIRQVNVVEAGCLKGGLKRRVVQSIYFEPGVPLCRN